jgi:glycosyltransferase involved in cell wall biosynthesis
MRSRSRPFDVVHVSSAHPWDDNRVHLRSAASAAAAGYRTALVAVANDRAAPDREWDRPDDVTGVYVRRIPRRSRARRCTLSSIQAVRAALASGARIVHLHDPELVWAVPWLRAAGRVVVYDAHEDLPDQVRGKEYLGPVARAVAGVVARAVIAVAARAHAVVAATPAIAGRFPSTRTTIVRNLPRHRPGDDAAAPPSARPARAVYLGAMSRDRGIDVLADVAAAHALPPGWRVTTAGSIDAGVDRTRFDALAGSGRLEHLGVLAPGPARDLLLTARVGLLPLFPTPAYATSIPTKLFEYLAAGLAVIATDIPSWRALLDGVDCVTWVPPGDAAAIARALRAYDQSPELLDEHAARGRRLVADRYRWESEAEALLDLYARIFTTTPFIDSK